MERVIFDQIRTEMHGETINKGLHRYFKADKTAEVLEKGMLRNEEFLGLLLQSSRWGQWKQLQTNIQSTYSKSRSWQTKPPMTQLGQEGPALCKEHRLGQVLKDQPRRATSDANNAEPAALAPTATFETEARRYGTWTRQCQWVIQIRERRLEESVT